MIIQESKHGITLRLELLGIKADPNESKILSNILSWLIGFLLACHSLRRKQLDSSYMIYVVEALSVMILQSNSLLDSLNSIE